MIQRLFSAGLFVWLTPWLFVWPASSINSVQRRQGVGVLPSGEVASDDHDDSAQDLVQACRNPRGGGVCEDLPARRSFAVGHHAAQARHLELSRNSAWAAVPPAGQGPALQRIMFGSCNSQTNPQTFWNSLLTPGEVPDVMVLGGDNVYGNCDTYACEELATAYERLAQAEAFQHFAEAVPVLAVWDDHDYGLNDGDGTWAGKEVAKQLFTQFFDAPEGQARHTPGRGAPGRGIEASYMIGPEGQEVQIILLDTRWYRDAFRSAGPDLYDKPGTERYVHDADISGTMLGAEQWQWLEEELARPARLRLVVSSIQLLSESHGWESWACLPSERSRMLGLLRATSPTPIVLSGDRHVAGLYRTSSSPEVLEVTGSSFTHTYKGPISDVELQDPLRTGDLFQENNIGLVEVDWDQAVVRLSLRRVENPGQVLGVIEVPL